MQLHPGRRCHHRRRRRRRRLAQAVAVATAVSAAVAAGSVAAANVAAVAGIGPRDLMLLCFVAFSCDRTSGHRVCGRLGAGWEGVERRTVRSQSGHSQVTVRSTVRSQSGLVNYKHFVPGANSIKIYSFLLNIKESQFVLVFTRPDCDLTVDLTVT